MSRKIKFHSFHILFMLFDFLADKSGGWRVFVRPKLLIGSMIVGLGLTACGTKTENKTNQEFKDSSSTKERNKRISLERKNDKFSKTTMCYAPILDKKKELMKLKEPMVTCYDTEVISNSTDSVKEIEVMTQGAEFPGGNDSLLMYLTKSIKYPSNESLQNIQGKVICRFVINEDGSISNIEVLRSLDPILDTIAINAIKSLPNFIPGRENGKVVRSYYTLPIHFRNQE